MMASSRESFLREAFAALDANSLPYCVSRNAGEVYRSVTSDVDLVVLPERMQEVERVLTNEAELQGYKLISRIEFTNICLVYWSPGADFVRIDLDGELRWLFFEVASARVLLEGATRSDGANVISPESEFFVMADRLAWQGTLPQKYKSRVSQLLLAHRAALNSTVNRIEGFLQEEDARGLRLHLIQRAIFAPYAAVSIAVYFFRDVNRKLRRACSPPGVFLRVAREEFKMDWSQLFRTMSMAFPESKCVQVGRSPLPGLIGLFRGGIVVADDEHSFSAWLCELFSNRLRRFRITNAESGHAGDLLMPISAVSVSEFADILASALSKSAAA